MNFGVVARREDEQRAELATSPEVLATVPFFDADIYDMAGLLRLGGQIWGWRAPPRWRVPACTQRPPDCHLTAPIMTRS